MMRKGWERLLPPAHFEKICLEKPQLPGAPPPQLNFNTLCLFHKPLVNQEKVLYFLKLKFDRNACSILTFSINRDNLS